MSSNFNQPQRRIGLVVDHPRRDLPGVALLAHELAHRGATAVIVPMYEQAVDVCRLGLDAIVANYIRSANAELLTRYSNAGLKVYVLDTEGAGTAEAGGNTPIEAARKFQAQSYGTMLTGYFFWGRSTRDAFANQNALPAGRCYLTGCPRFDFAAPRWRSLLKPDRRGYILVNANFPLINPLLSRSHDQELENMVSAGWDRDYVRRYLEDLKVVFKGFLAEIQRLASSRPEQKFLIRPHPFEQSAPYERVALGLSNMEVDGSGDVFPAIVGANAVLHLNCATAMDAILLGKLPIQLGYLNTPLTAGHASLPARVSRVVTSQRELLDVIDTVSRETEAFDFADIHAREIQAHLHFNDGHATKRVADVLLRSGSNSGSWISLRDVTRCSRLNPSLSQRAKGAVCLFAGSRFVERVRMILQPSRTAKRIKLEHLSGILADISRVAALDPSEIHASRALCRVTGLPLASLVVSSTKQTASNLAA
jgi:surface carbohydrate biosynthesis protein